jgi:hypothetical protein
MFAFFSVSIFSIAFKQFDILNDKLNYSLYSRYCAACFAKPNNDTDKVFVPTVQNLHFKHDCMKALRTIPSEKGVGTGGSRSDFVEKKTFNIDAKQLQKKGFLGRVLQNNNKKN